MKILIGLRKYFAISKTLRKIIQESFKELKKVNETLVKFDEKLDIFFKFYNLEF